MSSYDAVLHIIDRPRVQTAVQKPAEACSSANILGLLAYSQQSADKASHSQRGRQCMSLQEYYQRTSTMPAPCRIACSVVRIQKQPDSSPVTCLHTPVAHR